MRLSISKYGNWLFIISVLISLSSCQRTTEKTTTSGFLPPTEIPSPTATTQAVIPKPTPQIDCTDVLSYMEDITIPDGSVVKPGEELDKRWQVRNNGSCDWTDDFTLRIIAGDPLGSPETQALYPARSGSAAVIRMLLTAPQTPGNYRTAWQAFNPQNEPFGDPIYIEIIIQ